MKSQGSGRRVLRFAVTGVLLGGGVATGCAAKQLNANPGPKAEPEPHTNAGPEQELHANPGPEAEPIEPTEPDRVNTAPVDPPPDAEPGAEPPPVIANPAPQPDPGK